MSRKKRKVIERTEPPAPAVAPLINPVAYPMVGVPECAPLPAAVPTIQQPPPSLSAPISRDPRRSRSQSDSNIATADHTNKSNDDDDAMVYCPPVGKEDRKPPAQNLKRVPKKNKEAVFETNHDADEPNNPEDELQRYKQVVLTAVTQDDWALAHASEELRRDKEVVMAAVAKNGWAFFYASEELKRDKEVVMAAVTQFGLALQYACEEMQRDKEVVMAAVTQNGWAWQYACEELQRDKEVVIAAVTQNGWAWQYVCEELKRDKEVVMAAVTQNDRLLQHAPEEMKRDKEVVMAAVAQDSDVYFDLSEEMQRDPDVLLTIGTADASFLDEFLNECEADDVLRDDKQFITGLINTCSADVALDFASDDVRADREVVFAAVSQDSSVLRFVRDGGILGDKEIILKSLSGASSERDIPLVAYYHFMRNNVDFVLTSFKKN